MIVLELMRYVVRTSARRFAMVVKVIQQRNDALAVVGRNSWVTGYKENKTELAVHSYAAGKG